jgi:glutamine kinase
MITTDIKTIPSLTGTKAEVLHSLRKYGFTVPKVYFFEVKDWHLDNAQILNCIKEIFANESSIAVRSSTISEDNINASMAGAFVSILNIDPNNKKELRNAIKQVISSYDDIPENQILIQPMVENVAMSGVAMTRVLDDGSPYYAINFDDSTGLTDTVTNGGSINKTVYVYNGVREKDFDSPYLKAVLKLIWNLESIFPHIPLDIEFAVDKSEKVYLLQVRRITTLKNWKHDINDLVSARIRFLGEYVDNLMWPRNGLFGSCTLLGIMPDWNPAEMIGVVPQPLAMSLYRKLITKKTWYCARQKMGYRKMPPVELMVSLFGRAYIDVRNSFNSFLPNGLEEKTGKKLVDAFLHRLEKMPHLHDKIEFEVIPTAYDFEFSKNFHHRYPEILTKEEFLKYRNLLRNITKNAIKNSPENTLNVALNDIHFLQKLQNQMGHYEIINPFSLSDKINTLIAECIEFGTMPFSIIARHGFTAEALLRSAINTKIISEERINQFKRSVKTISSELSEDFYNVCNNIISQESFLKKYGHLRPSSYDILSPIYQNRKNLFGGSPQKPVCYNPFELTEEEKSNLNILLAEHNFDGIDAQDLFDYAEKAIKGREFAKFIFTRHLSAILEIIAQWGELQGFSRQEMAMLSLDEILNVLHAPLTQDIKSYFKRRIKKAQKSFDVASSFKLSYLIRSQKDIYIVPTQRSASNFIGTERIEAEVVAVNPYLTDIPDLEGKIVCVEGADPGYDWIFSRKIAGLVTKYGGANSHMAIRCAEYNLPAAIGCGEQPFERIVKAGKCFLDCQGKRLEPITLAIK